jgi:hypothetical protein
MRVTEDELQAVRMHHADNPAAAPMYLPVVLEWCSALLRQRDEAWATLRRIAEVSQCAPDDQDDLVEAVMHLEHSARRLP